MADIKLMSKGVELTDEQLEGISGGIIHFNLKTCNWEVVDFQGQVLDVFETEREASASSLARGLGAGEINDSQLAKMRAGDSVFGDPVDWPYPLPF